MVCIFNVTLYYEEKKKFIKNSKVETIKIGCNSFALPLKILTKQYVINPNAIPVEIE